MSVRLQFTALRANARAIPSLQIQAALDKYTRDFCQKVVDVVSVYPGPVSGSRYERTGRLLRNWAIRDTSSGLGIQYQIRNAVQDAYGRYYSGYVSGQSEQTWFHRAHGWRNIGDVVNELGGHAKFQLGAQAIINQQVR